MCAYKSADNTTNNRETHLQHWLQQHLPQNNFLLQPLPQDASFRRYWRVTTTDVAYILMDAPPAQESSQPFVDLAQALQQQKIPVPQIIAADTAQGFILMTDFGDRQLLQALTPNNADQLYKQALHHLLAIQKSDCLPQQYQQSFLSGPIQQEVTQFQQWFIDAFLQLSLSRSETQSLNALFSYLLDSATQQPQHIMHRDYHSRNIMLRPDNSLGILDFQDACIGPITYDIVSLLEDCYIAWPRVQKLAWLHHYYQAAQTQGLLQQQTFAELYNWFDLMGMQRHLKAGFIFARKWLRDNDPRYLGDLPRTLRYVSDSILQQPRLQPWKLLWFNRILTPFKTRYRHCMQALTVTEDTV